MLKLASDGIISFSNKPIKMVGALGIISIIISVIILIYALISFLAVISSANSYDITGTSNVSTLDGRMLYLKVLKDAEFKSVDSCDVVHGQFHFDGTLDSVRMANIFMDDEPVLPLVLESGAITVKLDDTQQVVRQVVWLLQEISAAAEPAARACA